MVTYNNNNMALQTNISNATHASRGVGDRGGGVEGGNNSCGSSFLYNRPQQQLRLDPTQPIGCCDNDHGDTAPHQQQGCFGGGS